MRWRIAVAVATLLLASCASHTHTAVGWAPGPGAAGTFEENKGFCSLLARNSGGSFFASGDPDVVAGAIFGGAAGGEIEAQRDFNDCMRARGWVPVDEPGTANASAPPANGAAAAAASAAPPTDQHPIDCKIPNQPAPGYFRTADDCKAAGGQVVN